VISSVTLVLLILLELYLNEKRSKLCDIKSATILLGDLTIAFALVLVFEGVLYALFPLQMKKFMIKMVEMPVTILRNSGLAAAVIGVILVWLLRG